MLILIELRAPTLRPNVLITPLLEILVVFTAPVWVVIPNTPRVPELDVFTKVPVPAFSVFVEILALLEILVVFATPNVVVPATPRVPVLEVLVKEPVAAKSVFVEILPVLLIFTEVRTLPKSSFPTNRFVI